MKHTDNEAREDLRHNVGKIILDYRKRLHRAIVKTMMDMELCTNEKIIEAFKRRYLMDVHSVETSRAFDLKGLKDAMDGLNDLTAEFMIKTILLHYPAFNSARDLNRCSNGQVGKMQKIALYILKIEREALAKYAETTFGRKVYLYDMSVEEAHTLIKRLEEWEAKVITGKKY